MFEKLRGERTAEVPWMHLQVHKYIDGDFMEINDRLVEVPYMCKQLQKYRGRVLDVGSAGTDLLEVRRQKMEIVRVDKNEIKDDRPDEKRYQADIRDLKPSDLGKFDIIMLISTLEHVALDGYGFNDRVANPWAEQKRTLEYCSTFLKPKGIIILTIPYGREEDGGWYLIYNSERLDKLRESFDVINEAFFTIDQETWTYNHVSRDKCVNKSAEWVRSDFARASNVACMVLRRKNV